MAPPAGGRRGHRWGRRCDIGCETWPDTEDYEICPICGEDAPRWSNLSPLEPEEAEAIVNHLMFERFYDEDHEPDLEPRRAEAELAERSYKNAVVEWEARQHDDAVERTRTVEQTGGARPSKGGTGASA